MGLYVIPGGMSSGMAAMENVAEVSQKHEHQVVGLSNPTPRYIIYNIEPFFIYIIYEEAKEDGKEISPCLYLLQQYSL